jgi:small conductance mechanosensitive channel
MINFITSKQFFLPLIYISLGVIIFNIISRILLKIIKTPIKGDKIIDKKKKTIVSLIRNVIKYLIAIIVVLAILNVYGINTSSIIAGLGVAGVVIGLAFEDLVKDLIAGIAIIFDNHYEVGDYISVNDFMGEVISVGLKTTKIKAYTGEVKIISNSAFNEVINYSMADYKLILKVKLSYQENIEKFENAIKDIEKDILSIEGTKKLSLLGIDSYDDSSISYAIEITCKAMSQYAVKRKSLKLIKNKLDKENITIPYNVVDVNINKK